MFLHDRFGTNSTRYFPISSKTLDSLNHFCFHQILCHNFPSGTKLTSSKRKQTMPKNSKVSSNLCMFKVLSTAVLFCLRRRMIGPLRCFCCEFESRVRHLQELLSLVSKCHAHPMNDCPSYSYLCSGATGRSSRRE